MKHFLVLALLFLVVVTGYLSITVAQGSGTLAYAPIVYKNAIRLIGTATPTFTATVTRTATPTATVTPTPTRTPYSYFNDEDPNLPLPDGPNGVITTTLTVPDVVLIRGLRIFLNVQHDEVSDLTITMIHPNGTRLLLHQQGENPGDVVIRRWFPVTGDALESIRGTSAEGGWTLELRDDVENLTGELLSWGLEIYP